MDNGNYLKQMGKKIKTARLANNMSLPKLSKKCNTDMSNLWFIENGKRNAHILTLKAIADAFNMNIKDFL